MISHEYIPSSHQLHMTICVHLPFFHDALAIKNVQFQNQSVQHQLPMASLCRPQLLLMLLYLQSQISPFWAPNQTYVFSPHIQEIQTWSGCTQTEICFYSGDYREEIHRLRWRGCERWRWRTGYVSYTAGYVLWSLQLLINETKHS